MAEIIRYSTTNINLISPIVIFFVMFVVYDVGKCDAVFPQDRWKPVLHKSMYAYGVTTILLIDTTNFRLFSSGLPLLVNQQGEYCFIQTY